MFSAGSEGIIKVWNISKPENVDALGSSDKNLASVGEWQGHHEVIWDLNHHPTSPLMLSAGADCFIKLWRTFSPVESTSLISL